VLVFSRYRTACTAARKAEAYDGARKGEGLKSRKQERGVAFQFMLLLMLTEFYVLMQLRQKHSGR